MLGVLENLPAYLFVLFGAILGSNIRFIIYKKLSQLKFSKYYTILLINSLASLFFGLFYAISLNYKYSNYLDRLSLFFLVGCLGSLSTFSTFIYDLFELSSDKSNLLRTLKVLILSLSLGIISFAFGCFLGNQ